MGDKLIKIECELDLVNAVLRAIYDNSENEPVQTKDIIKAIQAQYDVSGADIESIIEVLFSKYGLIDKHVKIITNPEGKQVSETVKWSLEFDTRGE